MEARYYVREEGKIRCELCPHRCLIAEGATGLCRVRKSEKGILSAESYGRITALQVDPIEKKPLAYFHPGEKIFSIGSYGCNLRCPFCQNFSIAHGHPATTEYTPEEIVAAVKRRELTHLAFTYNEPIVSFEFVLDTAKAAKKAGLVTVMVTNGYIEQEPLKELLPWIDAWNIDLKGFREETYQKLGGKLAPVLETIKSASRAAHVEITTLLVPGINDNRQEMKDLFQWIGELDPEIPIHLTRYFPAWKYDKPSTDLAWMQEMAEEARKVCKRVKLGNVWEV